MAAPQDHTLSSDRIADWAARLTRVSHLGRIALGLAITLVLAILAWVVVDRLVIDEYGNMTSTFVAVAAGLLVYGGGWWALVGFDEDPRRPWQAGPAAVWFVAAGAAGLVALIMLAALGLAFGYVF